MATAKKNAAEKKPEQAVEATLTEAPVADVEEVTPRRPHRSIGVKSATYRKTESELDEQKKIVNGAIEMYRSAAYNKTILLNKISTVQPFNIKGKTEMYALAISLPGYIKALIPYNEVFPDEDDPIAGSTVNLGTEDGRKDYLRRQRQVLDRMLGAETRWVAKEVFTSEDGKDVVILGSRKAAMALDRKTFYTGPNPVAKNNHVYAGRIVFVTDHSAMVVFGGIAKVIPQETLTNRYAPSMKEIFKSGDKIYLCVRDLTVNGDKVSVNFDCLTGELCKAQERHDLVTPDSFVCAHISKSLDVSTKDGERRTRYYGWIDNWDLPLKVTGLPVNRMGIPPKIGDAVTVKVIGIDEDGYVTGYIRTIQDRYSL